MFRTLRQHWPEFLIEGALLGLFMISASGFTMLMEHPASPVVAALPDAFMRRALIGVAMGLTAIALIFSPWGQRSGAHMNPAVTLTFLRLGKVKPWDAAFYVAAQFAGGVAGVGLVSLLAPSLLADPSVRHVATVPGAHGVAVAFLAEFVIAFVLMLTVLTVSNHTRLSRWTGCIAGALVATYITIEAPLSGMSMNPARTFGSALHGQIWTALWIYFTAPVLAMQAAASVYHRAGRVVHCAKLHHHNSARCIFNCAFSELARKAGPVSQNTTAHHASL